MPVRIIQNFNNLCLTLILREIYIDIVFLVSVQLQFTVHNKLQTTENPNTTTKKRTQKTR